MGNSFKLDDLLGTDTTEAKPTKRKGAQQDQGYALDDLLGPDTATAPRRDTGDVDLSKLPAPAPAPAVAPRPAPAPRRGIGAMIADALGLGDDPNRVDAGNPENQIGAFPEALKDEARTPAQITDYRTQRERTDAAAAAERRRIAPVAPDATTFSERGTVQGQRAAETTRTTRAETERFTPEGWRDVAKRGMAYTNSLAAKAEAIKAAKGADSREYVEAMRAVDEAGRQSYNAQLKAEGAAEADTPAAIAYAAALGVIHDPFVQSRKNMATADTFTPSEQKTKLGMNLPQAITRPGDLTKDMAIPLAAGLVPFIAGDAAVAKGAGMAADALLGGAQIAEVGAGRRALVRGLEALAETEPKVAKIAPGERLGGVAGLRQEADLLGENLGTQVKHGMAQGQVTGAVIAGREAEQRDESPTEAILGSVLGNAALGGAAGALLPVVGAATRSTRNLLTEGLQNLALEASQEGRAGVARGLYNLAQPAFEADAPRAVDWAASRSDARSQEGFNRLGRALNERAAARIAADPEARGAIEGARAVEGKTPLADQTPEGQHATIAKALTNLLEQRTGLADAEARLGPVDDALNATRRPILDPVPFDPARQAARQPEIEGVPPIIEPGSALTPRENPGETALPSAADIAARRVPSTPSDEANAVVQMQRARMEQEAMAAHVAAEQEALRVEQAATARAVEKQGPLTLGQTLARASREAEGETPHPMAVEYKDAINKYADALAAVRDAGENISERAKLNLARTKAALDSARRKYGTLAGAAAIVALADANSDLTDDEKKMVGLAALPVLATHGAVRHVLPEEIARLGRRALETIESTRDARKTVTAWTDFLREKGVPLGEHFSSTVEKMREVSRTQPDGMLDMSDVYDILRPDKPLHPAAQAALDVLRRVQLNWPDDIVNGHTAAEWRQRLMNFGLAPEHAIVVHDMIEDEFGMGGLFPETLAHRLDDPDTIYPEPRVEPISKGFASRLANVLEQTSGDKVAFPKKWDQPQPAADWIGKLKGMPERVSAKELATILPFLEHARDNKVKLARGDVLALADLHRPQIERVTLEPSKVISHRHQYDSEDIVPIDDVPVNDRGEITTQIDARRNEVERLQAYVDSAVEDAEQDYQYKQRETEDKRREFIKTIKRAFPDISDDTIDKALEAVAEDVNNYGAMRDRGVDRAMTELYDSGEVDFTDEARDPDSQGIDLEEHTNDDGETTHWTATASNGHEVEAPTKWQALALLEDEGLYDSGSTERVVPNGVSIHHEEKPPKWAVKSPHGWTDYQSNEWMRGMSDEEVEGRLRSIWGTNYTYERIPNEGMHWIVRDHTGYEVATAAHQDAAMDKAVEYWFSAKAGDDVARELKSDLEVYGYALVDESEAESQHYHITEGEGLSEEREKIDDYNTEIARLQEMHANAVDAPDAAPTEPRENPLLMPIEPPVKGGVHFQTYQRIPGGTEYAEMVNNWTNLPGGRDRLPSSAYGGHDYWTRADVPNAVGHVRAETHAIVETPGLMGERIEHFPDDTPRLKQLKDNVAENRSKRTKLLAKMTDIGTEFDRLRTVRDAYTGTQVLHPDDAARGNQLAQEFQTLNQQVIDIGNREDAIAKAIRDELGLDEPTPKRVRVMLESQASLAQFQIHQEFPNGVPDLAALQAEAVRTFEVYEQAKAMLRSSELTHYAVEQTAENWWSQLSPEVITGLHEHLERLNPDKWSYIPADFRGSEINNDYWKEYFDYLRQHGGPEADATLQSLSDARAALDRAADNRRVADEAWRDAQRMNDRAASYIDVAPFNDTAVAQQLNAARFLIDAAERGFDQVAWSDANNRIANAMGSKPKAARLWYDQMIPQAMRRVMKFAGLPEPEITKLWIKGNGHWSFTLPPEARAHIRKYGVPFLSVAAMMALPSDAEAQDGEQHEGPGKLWLTGAAGIAAGLLIAKMAESRKLRSLVKENRTISRELMLDDLSGLANARAHRLAVASIDRDPNTAWLAFDGDRFKVLNDTHGHPEGDKAIMHFGATIREAADKLGVPMRGFRAGGDEFAMAVPKSRAADVLQYIEEHSEYTKDGVTTKLTGAIGDQWNEADALLKNAKDAARSNDPSLRRDFRPEVEQKLSDIINDALDKPGMRRDLTMDEYMALSHEERMKYIDAGLTDLKGGLAEVEAAQERMIRETRRHMDLYANPIGPALGELRKYPSAAGLAVVGTLMATESDNRDVQRAGVPVMALAALSAIGSNRLIAGKDYLASKLVEQLRRTPEGAEVVRAFNPDALLDPAVKDAIVQFERDSAKGKARAVEFSGKAKALGGAGDRAVSDVLEGEEWEDISHMTGQQTTDILTVAAALEREYAELTKAQVNAGVLPQASVLPNYGGPRRYAYFDALDALADSPSSFGKPGRRPKIAPVKQRTLDVPMREAEELLRTAHASGDQSAIEAAEAKLDEARVVQLSRRVELGEIREASYRAAQGIERAHNSVAAAKLFDTIRNVPGSAHPEWVNAVDDLLAAKQMRQGAITQADKEAADLMFNEATVALDEVTRKYKQRGGEYVSLPDVASLGVLRGAVVKRDIAHSLEGFGAPGLYGKTIRAWKEIKTVFNPGTSIGNILSNVTALHMGEVPVWLQPFYLTKAAKDLRSYGEATRALAEAGVLNVNSVNALGQGELGAGMRKEAGLEELLPTTRPETQKVLREQGITEARTRGKVNRQRVKRMAIGATIGAAKGYDPEHPENAITGAAIGAGAGAVFGASGIRKVYDNEDNIARLAVFLRRRALGDNVEQATEAAINSLGNFRSRSPALKLLSSTVSPFIMYQAKAVPAFAKNVVDHPWKYMTLIAAWGAMNEMGKQEMGEVPERDIPVNQRKTYGYFFPGFTQLPFGDEKGNKGAVDMARWTPMSGLTTGAPPGSVPEAFGDNGMALVTPGGPVIDAALRGSNVDPFKKEPRLKRDRPTSENVGKVLNDAADFVLPSALGFHASRLKGDIDNEDWTKFKNDLLGPTGIKPQYVRPGAVVQDASFTLERSLRDMKQELKVALRANKNPERVKELVARYQRDVATALVNFKDRIGSPPDRELVEDYMTPDQ